MSLPDSIATSFRPVATCLLLALHSGGAGATPSFRDGSPTEPFARSRSADFAAIQAFREGSLLEPVPMEALALTPHATHGLPGVAIFDADGDGDGDLDVFVSNGPGSANGLYQNQLAETGTASYVDVASLAGVDAVEMDANGVCAGDTDNDGDTDLLVLGRGAPNRFFVNQGNGRFVHNAASGLEGGSLSHVGCSMGDVDGDGLLDVAVANAFDMSMFLAIFVDYYAFNQANQLFLNQGGGSFTEASDRISVLDRVPTGASTISWAVAMVDVDRDGDTDILFADDQGALPTEANGGVDRGFIHVLKNDGTGHFEDHAIYDGPNSAGSWMGIGLGDLDCNGTTDIFGSNFGDYAFDLIGTPYTLGEQATRHYSGNGDGTFTDAGLGTTSASVFGWGNAVFDADNDGDPDVVYHGGLDMNIMAIEDNPGVVLLNDDCSGNFTLDLTAMGARHHRRNVRGVAVGDLDRDGFVDVVSAASFVASEPIPLVPGTAAYGSPLDAFTGFVPLFAPTATGLSWTGLDMPPGDLRIDLNDGTSGFAGVTVRPVGAVDLARGAVVNRGGIGATIELTPRRGRPVAVPITAGASHVSSHAPEAYFGLGTARTGTVDILWPGGVRNRVHRVRAGTILTLPEIPCSYDSDLRPWAYGSCVVHALSDLRRAGVVSFREALRLGASAWRAYIETH